MEENIEDTKERSAALEMIEDSDIFSFGYLVSVILDYYATITKYVDPAEKWKTGTEHEVKNAPEIPTDIDVFVKKAFKKQLKKFS